VTAPAPARRAPSRATKSGHAGMGLHAATVRAVQRLTPHLVRITLGGPTLRGFLDDGPDQRVKLMLPLPGQDRPVLPSPSDWYGSWRATPADVRPVLRTYTVRHARPAAGELDVDVVLHGDTGPASAWAGRAAVGDEVGVYGAYGEYEVPPGTDWQVLVADHTALPAVAAVLERRPAGDAQPVLLLVEVPGAADELPLALSPGVEVRWCHAVRGRPGAALVEAATTAQLPDGTGYAWVCAEQGAVREIRRHLLARCGLPCQAVMSMGYWRAGSAVDPC